MQRLGKKKKATDPPGHRAHPEREGRKKKGSARLLTAIMLYAQGGGVGPFVRFRRGRREAACPFSAEEASLGKTPPWIRGGGRKSHRRRQQREKSGYILFSTKRGEEKGEHTLIQEKKRMVQCSSSLSVVKKSSCRTCEPVEDTTSRAEGKKKGQAFSGRRTTNFIKREGLLLKPRGEKGGGGHHLFCC